MKTREKSKRQIVTIEDAFVRLTCPSCKHIFDIEIQGEVKGNFDIPCNECGGNTPCRIIR